MIRQRTVNPRVLPTPRCVSRAKPGLAFESDDAVATPVRDLATDAAAVLIPGFAAISTAVWLIFLRWYGLSDRIEFPYFAFEKIPGQFDSAIMHRTLALFLIASFVYVCACLVLAKTKRLTNSIKLGAVGLIAGPAVVNIFLFPVGALDIFNYMVDLKLAFHFGDNPYLVTNPSYLKGDPFVRSAFLLNIPLFYGPAWLMLSGIPALIAGFNSVLNLLIALKVFNLVLLALTALMIARSQPNERRRWLAPVVFLGNPLVVFEGIGNAHNDVMMTVFMVAALYALRGSRRSWLGVPALALSALVKLFSAALAPLLFVEAVMSKWPLRRFVIAGVVTVAVVIVTAAPFWDGGKPWDGFLEGTRLSQRMDHVSPLSLAQQQLKQEQVERAPSSRYLAKYASSDIVPRQDQDKLHRQFTILFVVLALVVIAARMKRLISLERAAALTLILFSLLMTNLYPWYLIPIFALLALDLEPLGLAYVFAATALGLAYYPAYVWAHFNTGMPLYSVHLYLAMFLTAPMIAFLLVDVVRVGWIGLPRSYAAASHTREQ